MKKDLLDLIKRAESLEEFFRLDFGLTGELPDEKISDVPAFQEWLQALIYELSELNEVKKSEYIAETLLLINNGFHGGRDRKDFITLHGRLKVIESNIDRFYPENKVETGKESHSTMKPKIFISHSTKDEEYAKAFVYLLSKVGLDSEQVFCSSLPTFDIPVGNDIFDYLLKQFSAYHLHMVFLHSANYYASPVALNEMGAAWALKSKYTSFLLPGFNFEDMKAVVQPSIIAIKLDSEDVSVKDKLNQFYDSIVKEFELSQKPSIHWEKTRDAFIAEVNRIYEEPLKSSEQHKEKLELSEEARTMLSEAVNTSSGIIIKISTLSGTTVKIGDKVMNQIGNRRNTALWESALEELLSAKLVIPKGTKGGIFEVTHQGYLHME